MNPTQEQLNARIRDSISPPTPVTVDASRLSGGSAINFPQTPKLDQPLSLANFSINDAITANNQTTQAETERKGGLSRIAELTKSLFNKPADTQTLEQSAGLPDMTKQLTDANNQFRLTAAEQNQLIQEAGVIPLQMQEKFKGTGATTGGVAPIQASALRENAIKQYAVTSKGLFQQALISNLRDDIAGAEKAVEKAIQYKYAPQEQEIAYLKDWLQYNAQDLTREESKKAQNLNMVLDERTRLLNIAKEDDKITQGFVAEAIKTSQSNGTPVPQLLLQRASEAKTPNEALQILAPYMVDADAKADALLDRQIKQAQLGKIQAEAQKIRDEGKTPVVDTSGRLVMSNEDAQKINKEIVGTDAYKAITKAKDSLQFLDNFDTQFKDSGTTSAVWSPKENAAIKLKYNSTILNLKEFFNLGVLNGPDETILRGVLPDPSNTSVLNATRGAAVQEGITNMKTMIDQTLDDRYRSIKSQYGAYSPQTVSVLKDLDRVYVEQKSRVNPEVARMRKENPSLSDQDIINILGK